MLAFFYSLFYSLITGNWSQYTLPEARPAFVTLGNRLTSLIVNALGGHFETQQLFVLLDATLTAEQVIAVVLSIVAMIMVCLAVFKLTKAVFSIFFGGR